jgi:hypothetical protein
MAGPRSGLVPERAKSLYPSLHVADGSKADKPSLGQNRSLSALVRKPTNYCDAAIVRFVPVTDKSRYSKTRYNLAGCICI